MIFNIKVRFSSLFQGFPVSNFEFSNLYLTFPYRYPQFGGISVFIGIILFCEHCLLEVHLSEVLTRFGHYLYLKRFFSFPLMIPQKNISKVTIYFVENSLKLESFN